MDQFWLRNASELLIPHPHQPTVERLPGGSLYAEGGRIVWVGSESEAPEAARSASVVDAQGRAVLPALVDCHTHLIWAGQRIDDFERRARGLGYAQIAAQGGGILTTVRATRAASDETLLYQTRQRLEARRRYGIGTTEIKSGYGLTIEDELRILEIVAALRTEGWDLEATLLGAHAVPKDRPREAFVRDVIEEMIPRAAKGLARFADVFVESGAFTADEARQIMGAARRFGLIPKLHADQLTAGGGAELASELEAASADHLEHVSPAGIAAMAKAGVVAVLLPGALTYLGHQAPGLGRKLVDGGVRVAVATDTNPGSSPSQNLPLMGTLAVTQLGLTPDEAIWAMTQGGAHALRRQDVGHLRPGAWARLLILDDPDGRALVANFGEPTIRQHIGF